MNCQDCKHWKRAETFHEYGFCAKDQVVVKRSFSRTALVECVLTGEMAGCDRWEESGAEAPPPKKEPKRQLPYWEDPDEKEAILYSASTANVDRRS